MHSRSVWGIGRAATIDLGRCWRGHCTGIAHYNVIIYLGQQNQYHQPTNKLNTVSVRVQSVPLGTITGTTLDMYIVLLFAALYPIQNWHMFCGVLYTQLCLYVLVVADHTERVNVCANRQTHILLRQKHHHTNTTRFSAIVDRQLHMSYVLYSIYLATRK